MNDTLKTILEIPLFFRAMAFVFVIWFIYMLFAREIFKLISFVPVLFNFLWVLIYRLINSLMHVIHKSGGRIFSEADQVVTDVFGAIYGFANKVGASIDDCRYTRSIAYDDKGRERKESDGSPIYNRLPKKPFVGAALIISAVMFVWIALPTWLNTEENENFITAPYHKYIEIEGKILTIVFGE